MEKGDEVQKCEKCHTEPTVQGEMKLPPDQKKLNLKIAFHNKCQTCHKKLKSEKPESKAPTDLRRMPSADSDSAQKH